MRGSSSRGHVTWNAIIHKWRNPCLLMRIKRTNMAMDILSGCGMHSSTGTDLRTPAEEESTDVDMMDSSRMWMAPDASFSKHISKSGSGFTAPNDGSVCCVTLTVPALNVSATDSHLDLGYPTGEEVKMTLGNGLGKFSELVDACLETMHQGEESKLNILGGKCDKHPNSAQGKQDSSVSSRAICKNCVIATVSITLHSFTRNKDVFEMSVADILVRAKELKGLGTQSFKDGRQRLAEGFYIRALRYLISVCHPKDIMELDKTEMEEFRLLKRTCSLNLAACQLKCKRYRDVVTHCSYALHDEPTNMKALYRRCQAYLALDEFEQARVDIQTALDADPKNKPFLEQHRLLVKREKQVYNKLSVAMNKIFGGGS